MKILLIFLLLLSDSLVLNSGTHPNPYRISSVEIKEKVVETSSRWLKLSKKESGNNWKKWNSLGYIGLYQFGKEALEATGYGHITAEAFISNPYIWPPKEQEKAMSKLLALNSKALDSILKNNVGDTIRGIVITRSGLLAAAHIAGAGGVKKFIATDGHYDPADINGTKLSYYLEKFKESL